MTFFIIFIEELPYVNPQKRNEAGALTAISNLAIELCTPVHGALNKVFQNVQQKKKFAIMLEISGESFKWIPHPTTIFF